VYSLRKIHAQRVIFTETQRVIFTQTEGVIFTQAHQSTRTYLDGQEKLELWGKLLLGIQAIGKVDAANAAVRVDLYAKRLNVVRTCVEREPKRHQ
jgi:hypothetical protein